MKFLRRLSIYYKITGIIVLTLLLLSIIIGFTMLKTTAALLEYQMEKRGAEVAANIAALSSNDIILDDSYKLFNRLNQTKKNNRDVRYILITDSSGQVLAHTFSGNLPQGLPLPLSYSAPSTPPFAESNSFHNEGLDENYQIAKFNSNEGIMREVIVPIEKGAIGYVRVGMAEKITRQLLRKNITNFFIITLSMCFLAALIAMRLAYVIILPIRDLARVAGEIKKGNFAVKTFTAAEDEIGHLATVFNEMSDALHQKQQENTLLLQELRAKEELRATLINKLYTVQEDERRRLSLELHDETSQSMISLLAYMKLLSSKLKDTLQKNILFEARDVAVSVLDNLRKLAVELRPPVLDDLGVIAAMEKYIENFMTRHLIPVHFSAPNPQIPFPDSVSLALYRILQESLGNIVKYAHASEVHVTLRHEDSTITLSITDNGIGLLPDALEIARKNNRLGIYGMKERAELLGGSFMIHSEPAQGTAIIVRLPLDWSEGHEKNQTVPSR